MRYPRGESQYYFGKTVYDTVAVSDESFLKLRAGGLGERELNNRLRKDQLLIITFNAIEDISSRITLDSFSRDEVR